VRAGDGACCCRLLLLDTECVLDSENRQLDEWESHLVGEKRAMTVLIRAGHYRMLFTESWDVADCKENH